MTHSVQENYKKESFPNSQLYAVLFHYSHYRKVWACFDSGEKGEYFNGTATPVGYGNNVEEAFLDYKIKENGKEDN